VDYDRLKRDQKSRTFYNSAAWKRCRLSVLARTPWCSYTPPGSTKTCGQPAQHVHHVTPISTTEGWKKRLDHAGLMPVCISHHNQIEAEAQQLPHTHVAGMLELAEDDEYRFDAAAADRPIRFIEKFCRHENGEPFILEDVQRKIIRDVYGFFHRSTGHRRTTEVFWEAAIGAGKSPLLAALGLFELMTGGRTAQIIVTAATFQQANIIFRCAKKMIEQEPALDARLKRNQYEIIHRYTGGWWRIVSGTAKVAGLKPTLVLIDEYHEAKGRETYDSLKSRLAKTPNGLLIGATNAGKSRETLWGTLHEEAAATLEDPDHRPGLYPIVWAATKNASPTDPNAWKAANPLVGVTILQSKIVQEWRNREGDPALEAEFRRLYLGQYCQNEQVKWLNIDLWDANTKPFTDEDVKDLPMYASVDMSLDDDLTAVNYVWVSPEMFYVSAHAWLPKHVAERYDQKHGTKYQTDWKEWITLVDEPTISVPVRHQIADAIMAKGNPLMVCYDRYKMEDTQARLEAAGVKCEGIGQGYSISPGCSELSRRLKEHSITFQPNKIMRAHAEIVEVKTDDRQNLWPVKPGRSSKGYIGLRHAKIDHIAALVTALSKAREHIFPDSTKKWGGKVWAI
jgi:phage terminase large subunit-like protein